MDNGKILDIAHISFLDMINVLITTVGTASAKGTLIRNAMKAAETIDGVSYSSMDDYLKAIEDGTNPITRIEGRAVHVGNNVFGLPNCPFAPSIKNYNGLFGKLPDGYKDLTEDCNRPNAAADKLRVAHGACVSPFCAVHQPMRSAFGEKISINGKKAVIYQLGCKSGGGVKGMAGKWIAETGVPREVAEKVLDDNMCCYYVTTA